MKLFHAGVGIRLPFFPFTHFGTRQAALDRLKSTVREKSHLSQITLLEVTFEDAGLRIVDTTDFGSPKPYALLARLLPNDRSTFSRVSDQLSELKHRKGIDPAKMKKAERAIVLDAVGHTCDALRYVNDHEDAGQTSYCILEPHFTKIKRRKARQVSEDSAELKLGDAIATITLLKTPIEHRLSVIQRAQITLRRIRYS